MAALLVALSYLCGAIPVGVLICRAKGVDIRAVGSGNVGATNVARALGVRWAAVVLLLDVLKGWGPVLLARVVVEGGAWQGACVGLCMVASVVGHVFPVFERFRGGKGVATGLGATLAVSPIAGAVAAGLYALAYAVLRISSVGSLVGTAGAVAVLFALDTPGPIRAAMVAIAALILVRHRDNLRRLRRGEE